MKTKTAVIAFSLVFAIPFLMFGLIAGFLAVKTLHGVHHAAAWEPVQATIIEVDLKTSRSEDSTSSEVKARYRYDYRGKRYEATRVGFMGGADSVDNWQQYWYDHLRKARDDGQLVQIWIDPAHPEEAVIDRGVRWNQVAFLGLFAVLFSAVGLGAFYVFWKARCTPAERFEEADADESGSTDGPAA